MKKLYAQPTINIVEFKTENVTNVSGMLGNNSSPDENEDSGNFGDLFG